MGRYVYIKDKYALEQRGISQFTPYVLNVVKQNGRSATGTKSGGRQIKGSWHRFKQRPKHEPRRTRLNRGRPPNRYDKKD